MRSGTSNCHVRLSREPIDSPLVTSPNMLLAMNEPSLKKFDADVQPGGWVIYNGDAFPEDCEREDVHVLALPFTQIADELGDARAANMVMLGALLEITGALPQASVDAALTPAGEESALGRTRRTRAGARTGAVPGVAAAKEVMP